jgi:short subunit dehydrogenase-like uncharacterized protein
MRDVIVLYGATGYTGRLVTQELRERGADYVLGGRNRQRLDDMAGGAPVRVASVDDDASLRTLLDGADVLINCAGPFSRAGEPVVRAAVDAGVPYLDSTGEQTFIRTVFERYGAAAERRGIPLVPACGFDYVPGDCIARIAARGCESLERIALAYSVQGFGMSRGTMRSALDMMKGGNAVEYRDGDWRAAPGGVFRSTFDFGPPIGRVPVSPYPAGEPITVPRHTDVRNVTAVLSTRTAFPPPLVPLAPYVAPLFAQALRTPLRPLLDRAIDRLPEGPSEADRRAAAWTIVAEAAGTGLTVRRAVVRGRDVYGLTARALVWAAERIVAREHRGAGALGPAAAFDPEEMLGALSDFGVGWDAETDPAPVH